MKRAFVQTTILSPRALSRALRRHLEAIQRLFFWLLGESTWLNPIFIRV